MAIGDCKTFPCASPLDFDSLLVSLFATDTSGCLGIKTYGTITDCASLTSAAECASHMTLRQIIEQSIVDDGNDGNALNVWLMTDSITCSHECANADDMESLLKGLFATDGNCFGLRLYLALYNCEEVESFAQCAATLTAEQIIKAALWVDDCGNDALAVNIPVFETCEDNECGLELTMDQLIGELFYKAIGTDCGAIKINYLTDEDEFTDIIECGAYRTFEQVFRAAVTQTDCGLAVNVWSINQVGRGEQ